MQMKSVLLFALLALLAGAWSVEASIPAQEKHASPIAAPVLSAEGTLAEPVSNPPVTSESLDEPKALKKEDNYLPGTDFMGRFGGVPINPTAHLQRNLADDKEYIASILRTPTDLGDPTDCKHSDIVKDELELRKIALRINHRRVSLRQQQHWIDAATEGLKRIETEIAATTNTARNLAEQADALQAQKEDITNHVRRQVLIKELDATSGNLMRLKNARMKEEVAAQKRHNARAIKNSEHNKVLERLHRMRTQQGLALGKLNDPKPYRFQQVEAEAETQTETEATQEADSEAEAESEVEADSNNEAESTQSEE
jgi:hypothetical protein